ncbi:unnamed protein product [Scytosiphon promiscuus]
MLLRRGKPGTFLLRFSGSEAGALVVSFTERALGYPRCLAVTHCVIEVHAGGACSIRVGKGNKTYASLHDLVRLTGPLKTLYPDIPKAEAFYTAPLSRGSAADRGVLPREARGVTMPVPIRRAAMTPATGASAAPASSGSSLDEASVARGERDERRYYYNPGSGSLGREEEEEGGGYGGRGEEEE